VKSCAHELALAQVHEVSATAEPLSSRSSAKNALRSVHDALESSRSGARRNLVRAP